MKLILVPTDMSETASHALRYASALAYRFDAHLLVIYADPAMPTDAARELLELHIERNVSPRVSYEAGVFAQSPAHAIVEQACDTGADLIVMGTHGRTGLRRLIVGSVTEAVIRRATVPVIVVNAYSSEQAALKTVVASSFEMLLPKELLDCTEIKAVFYPISAEEIVDFARRNRADLIALDVTAAGKSVQKILHLSACPVLTLNEHTMRTDRERQTTTAAAVW